jgi:signal transduction histidine kinase
MSEYFAVQPMVGFARLSLMIFDHGRQSEVVSDGAAAAMSAVLAERRFAAPFDFLSARLQSDAVPVSPARRTLTIALVFLCVFMLVGLVAIYQSTRAVVDLSERRSRFVSSVTHELKTPLTNIRLYVEMLEQGIAVTPEREQNYLGILGSESARLSRLINNVLELAKLEKKQRHFQLRDGDLSDVLAEVQAIMVPKLDEEGFALEMRTDQVPVFAFDHEVMVQVLVNLIENSIKFGRDQAIRQIIVTARAQDPWVVIRVADTGTGIPRQALKKVFDDFYRADDERVRTAGGTGIGLALVKKFITALGGSVSATNNDGPGCTITIRLPFTTVSRENNPPGDPAGS